MSGRGTNTFKKFAVGDKDFATRILVLTLVATSCGGGFLFRDLKHIYTDGLYYGLFSISDFLGCFFFAHFLALRMGEFMEHFSIAESMGYLFGTPIRIITAISNVLFSAGAIAIQFQIIAKVTRLFVTIGGNYPIYIAVIIVLLYSVFGGVKSVTFTNVIQFIVFSTLIPVLVYLVSSSLGDYQAVKTVLITHPNFDLRQVVGFHPKFMNTLSFILLTMIPPTSPAIMQRFYMAKNVWQVRSFFSFTAIIGTFISISMLFLAIFLLVQNAELNPKKLASHILIMYPYIWLKGFLCIGVLALAMSTADSFINVAVVIIAHDTGISLKSTDKHKLLLARLVSVFVGLIALRMTFIEHDLCRLLLLVLSFYSPIISVPFLMAVLGFRPSIKSVLLGMGAGALTIIAFYKGLGKHLGIDYGIFPAMGMNLLFLMDSHYFLPKVPNTGWIGIKDKAPLLYEKQRKAWKREVCKEEWKNFNLTTYLKKIFPNNALICNILGGYTLLSTFANLYTSSNGSSDLFIYVLIMIGGVLCILYTAWQGDNSEKNPLIIYSYPLFIFSILFLGGGYMLHTHHYYPNATIIFLINILVGTFLLPWGMVLTMLLLPLTMYLTVPCSNNALTLIGQAWKGGVGDFSFIILLAIFLAILIVYLKNKVAKKDVKLITLSQEWEEERKTQMESSCYAHSFARATRDRNDEEDVLPKIIKRLAHANQASITSKEQKVWLKDSIDRLIAYRDFLEEKTYYEQLHIPLSVDTVNMQGLINRCIDGLKELDIPLKPIIHHQGGPITLVGDPIKLYTLLVNSMRFMQASQLVASSSIIHIYLGATEIKYELNREGDQFKNLPALYMLITTKEQTPIIKESYDELLDVVSPMILSKETDIYKKEMDYIVDAHYGCCFINNEEEALTIFPDTYIKAVDLTHILPLELNLIRDDVMNAVPNNPYAQLLATPASVAQEEALAKLLAKETVLAKDFIQETIQFVKKCHGDQQRQSGEPFYIHPMCVAELVLEEAKAPDVVLAALLHDVVEDSKVPLFYIKSRFGTSVASIVSAVTHMGDTFRKKKLTKKENQEHLRCCNDVRAVQVKMADRLHNVRTLKFRPREKQIAVARQTLNFYVPFAEAMGVMKLTREIRERCEEILKNQGE